jgi:hypothetical protein
MVVSELPGVPPRPGFQSSVVNRKPLLRDHAPTFVRNPRKRRYLTAKAKYDTPEIRLGRITPRQEELYFKVSLFDCTAKSHIPFGCFSEEAS